MNEEDAHLVPLYQKFPIEVVRGDGALVYDVEGREFIDLSGGYGVAIVGHSNRRVANAIAEQAHKLITCHGSIYNDSRQRYLSLLSKHLPPGLSRIFFSNSGAEANEVGSSLRERRRVDQTLSLSRGVTMAKLLVPSLQHGIKSTESHSSLWFRESGSRRLAIWKKQRKQSMKL